MRTLLQDKRVVAALSLVAILTVGWRAKSSWHRLFPVAAASAREVSTPPAPPPSSRAETGDPQSSAGAAGKANLASLSRTNAQKNFAAWESMFPIEKLQRDPFGPLLVAAVASPAPQTSMPVDMALTLQAISIEPAKSFVVINGHVLAVGELIGSYLVENISASEVWLKHAGGRKVLRMEFARPAPATPKSSPNTPPKS